MKKLRFLISSAALFFGFFILLVSLTAVSPVSSSTGDFAETGRSLYLDGVILPDHVAYPVLMGFDRLKLESIAPEKRINLLIEYSQRRLAYTWALLEKDNTALALTTLTKSEKYLAQAVRAGMKEENLSVELEHKLLVSLSWYCEQLRELNMRFPDADRVVVDRLIDECSSLLQQLEESRNFQ